MSAPAVGTARLIDTAGASRIVGVPARTLQQWRYLETGPPYHRLGHRTVRYDPTDLDVWLAGNRRAS